MIKGKQALMTSSFGYRRPDLHERELLSLPSPTLREQALSTLKKVRHPGHPTERVWGDKTSHLRLVITAFFANIISRSTR